MSLKAAAARWWRWQQRRPAGDRPGTGGLCCSGGSEGERSGHSGGEAPSLALTCRRKPARPVGRWRKGMLNQKEDKQDADTQDAEGEAHWEEFDGSP